MGNFEGRRSFALLAAALVACATLVVGSHGPVAAGSASGGGSIGPSSPTYNRVAPGSCAASGSVVPYSVLQFTQDGASATDINVTVTATGFSPVLTLYQGVFLADNAVVNCYVQASGGSGSTASINTASGALLPPFTTQTWYVVVAGTNPGDSGSYNVTFDLPSTGVIFNGDVTPSGPAPTTTTTTTSTTTTTTLPDSTPPVVTAPGDQTAEATGSSGATVIYAGASAVDDRDGSITPTCTPASGSVFALGDTTVTCTATDAAGNQASDTFTVTVQDTTDPTVTVPSGQTAEATGPDGADVSYPAATADDEVSTPTVECVPAAGSTFALGDTTVTCTATDAAGNQASDTFTVTVQDTTAPAFALPDLQAVATGPGGAAVAYAATATDVVDGSVDATCLPASDSMFALGDTTVDCTATDGAGNTGSGSFTVTVVDAGDPVLELPADITAEATGPTGAVVDFDVSATDDVDDNPEVVCAPSSGSLFALGPTDVACTATDNDGNQTSGSFTIRVADTTGPVIDLPSEITVQATGPDGAIVTYEATATDAVAGDVPVACVPPSGSLFPVGTTTVTCTATDASSLPVGFFGQARVPRQAAIGNATTETFTVIVAAAPTTTTTTGPVAPTSPSTTELGPSSSASSPTTIAAGDLPATGAPANDAALLAIIVTLAGSLIVVAAAIGQRHRAG